jgi:hypothetical protein
MPAKETRDDPVAMIAAVLDEDLVRVVTGDDDAGDEHPRNGRLERLWIVLRDSRRRIDRDADLFQEVSVRRESGHDVYETRRKSFAPRSVISCTNANGIGLDRRDATVPTNVNAPFLDAVLKIGEHPGLDLLVEGWAEVHHRDVRSGAPQVERRFGRRVSAADDDNLLLERLVPLAIDVRDVGQIFAGDAEPIGRAEVSRRDNDGACVRSAHGSTPSA